TTGQLWQVKLTYVSKWYSPSRFLICSMIASSTFGGLPLTCSNANTSDVNSSPSGTPAKTMPVSSPTRFTLKLGVLSNSAFSTLIFGERAVNSSIRDSISLDTLSSPALTFSSTSPSIKSRYWESCAFKDSSNIISIYSLEYYLLLNFSYKIKAWLKRFSAFFPFCWAYFTRMFTDILSSFDFLNECACVTADTASVNFYSLDDDVRVDKKVS